jgi:hypothetical protein
MAEEKHHHHLFHHKKDEEEQPAGGYGGEATGYTETTVTEAVSTGEDEYRKEEKEHKHKQHLGETGAVGAGGFALVCAVSTRPCLFSFFFSPFVWRG